MAGWGVRIRNSTGNLIIDGQYSNLALRQKGAISTGPSRLEGGFYTASLTVNSSTPVLATRSSVKHLIYIVTQSAGSTTYMICSLSQTNIEWFLFDSASTVQPYTVNYGVRVKKTDGTVAFDSRMPYLRIIDFFSGTLAPGSGTVNITKNYAKQVAVIQSQLAYYTDVREVSPGPNPLIAILEQAAVVTATGSQVTCTEETILFQGPMDPGGVISGRSASFGYAVVDIAGF